MKKILWISPYAPYDKIGHAGGKNHNFYIKSFAKSGLFDIILFTLAQDNQLSFLDCEKYGIDCRKNVIKTDLIHKGLRYLFNAESEYNPFNRYYGIFANYQRKLLIDLIKKEHNNVDPDIIILQWTQCLLLYPLIERLWPEKKIVAIEEDVSYLKYFRRYKDAKNLYSSLIWKYKYFGLKKKEIEYLIKSDLVVVNNEKDKGLLAKDGPGLKNVVRGPAYFDNYSFRKCTETDKTVVFYGAMNRTENELSIRWFIKSVMPLIPEYTLLVIGGGVKESLKQLERDNVKMLDFVDDPALVWKNSVCMVVPLLYGAGIKIKVLEAFSAGLPVLTNEIGIEGIAARPGMDYMHCNKPSDYADAIRKLNSNPEFACKMAENASLILKRDFDNDKMIGDLIDSVNRL